MTKVKMLAFVLTMVMVLSACGSTKEEGKDQSSAYQKGLEVVALLDEMVDNEVYVQLYTVNTEIQEVVEGIASGDYSEPAAVYQISFPGEGLSTLMEAMGSGASLEGMSEELSRAVEQKMIGAVISQINAMGGAVNLAAMSVCTASKTFIHDEISEDMIYLYVYENAVPAAVTFVSGDEGTVSASGTFLLCEELDTESEQSVTEFFTQMGAEVSVITE